MSWITTCFGRRARAAPAIISPALVLYLGDLNTKSGIHSHFYELVGEEMETAYAVRHGVGTFAREIYIGTPAFGDECIGRVNREHLECRGEVCAPQELFKRPRSHSPRRRNSSDETTNDDPPPEYCCDREYIWKLDSETTVTARDPESNEVLLHCQERAVEPIITISENALDKLEHLLLSLLRVRDGRRTSELEKQREAGLEYLHWDADLEWEIMA